MYALVDFSLSNPAFSDGFCEEFSKTNSLQSDCEQEKHEDIQS
jgi:hypothetical protein